MEKKTKDENFRKMGEKMQGVRRCLYTQGPEACPERRNRGDRKEDRGLKKRIEKED
ncbi:hypothetical protein [Methanosarcina sp. KYL-1]|uniref:hypothetical protein n=1 Tax=Methanosarcina sp. KYL-1 TaxID=2602068 RepID=UPI002100A00B|nr:hypothetical protein [Methanosarcina sp. KYL-1]